MAIEVRAPEDRFLTRAEGRTTWHAFSFGAHYDPGNVGFGALVALNDELLQAGGGYDDHPHRDTEIVTWVLSGALRHRDSSGHDQVLGPGEVQVLSAGSGVVHSEVSASGAPTRFVQSWLRPDREGLPPSYATVGIPPVAGPVTLAGGAGLPIDVAGAELSAVALERGDAATLPGAPRLHVYVATGELLLDGRSLGEGAAVRMTGEGPCEVAALARGTRLLVWALP